MMEAVSVQALCDRQPGNGATAAHAHKHSSAGSGGELQKLHASRAHPSHLLGLVQALMLFDILRPLQTERSMWLR